MQGEGYVRVENYIIRTEKLNVYQKLLIINILSNTMDYRISASSMAKRIPCSRRKLLSTMKELESMKILSVKKDRHHGGGCNSNGYAVNENNLYALLEGVHEVHKGGAYSARHVVNGVHCKNTIKKYKKEKEYDEFD